MINSWRGTACSDHACGLIADSYNINHLLNVQVELLFQLSKYCHCGIIAAVHKMLFFILFILNELAMP